jgi:ATP-binding cassette subfamily B protein
MTWFACAIPDQVWSELYASEESFRAWCDQQVWPQELLQLLERLDRGSADADESPLEQLEQALQGAVHCAPTPESVGAAIAAGQLVYVTSCWGEARVGQQLDAASVLPESDRFALRLVALAAPEAADGEDPPSPLVHADAVESAELLPPVSRFSPERNVVDSLHLLSAEGPIPETLACFQMLDAADEVAVSSGFDRKSPSGQHSTRLKPNLQLCGQLAASLGFM